jgi:hypothetical protein
LKDIVSVHRDVAKDFQRLLFDIQTYPSLWFLRLGASDLCNKEVELAGVLDNLMTAKVVNSKYTRSHTVHTVVNSKYTCSHTPIVLYYKCVKSCQEVKSFVPAPGVLLGWRHKVAAVMQEVESSSIQPQL